MSRVAGVFSKKIRSQVMAAIRSMGNKVIRSHGITGL